MNKHRVWPNAFFDPMWSVIKCEACQNIEYMTNCRLWTNTEFDQMQSVSPMQNVAICRLWPSSMAEYDQMHSMPNAQYDQMQSTTKSRICSNAKCDKMQSMTNFRVWWNIL